VEKVPIEKIIIEDGQGMVLTGIFFISRTPVIFDTENKELHYDAANKKLTIACRTGK